jgi:hypothetical protein
MVQSVDPEFKLQYWTKKELYLIMQNTVQNRENIYVS